jgi:hypothetical protein
VSHVSGPRRRLPPEPRDPLLGVKTALRMVQVVFGLLMLSVIAMLSYFYK